MSKERKGNYRKAMSHCFGDLSCPYCERWLMIKLSEKLLEGIVVCKRCGKSMLLDKKTCSELNSYNTGLRNSLIKKTKVTIYKGCVRSNQNG